MATVAIVKAFQFLDLAGVVLMKKILGLVVFALCCAPLCGCGGSIGGSAKYAPVEGTITFAGEPLVDATVNLRPEPIDPKREEESIGTTDANGKFTIKTGDKDGCPVGRYRVAVSKVVGSEETLPKYVRHIDSGLFLDVEQGMEPATFDLK